MGIKSEKKTPPANANGPLGDSKNRGKSIENNKKVRLGSGKQGPTDEVGKKRNGSTGSQRGPLAL